LAKKKHRKRYGSGRRACSIKNRVSIDERPQIVSQKQRLSDWEIDTIIGKRQTNAIVTVVERLSKKTLLGRVTSKKSAEVTQEIIALLSPIKPYVFTITADNGVEFAQHKLIAKKLDASIYFAHPYHSWERGLNENTNGLIRQFIPKKSDFSELTEQYMQGVMEQLNNRPRKSLGYKTPNEVFDMIKRDKTVLAY